MALRKSWFQFEAMQLYFSKPTIQDLTNHSFRNVDGEEVIYKNPGSILPRELSFLLFLSSLFAFWTHDNQNKLDSV